MSKWMDKYTSGDNADKPFVESPKLSNKKSTNTATSSAATTTKTAKSSGNTTIDKYRSDVSAIKKSTDAATAANAQKNHRGTSYKSSVVSTPQTTAEKHKGTSTKRVTSVDNTSQATKTKLTTLKQSADAAKKDLTENLGVSENRVKNISKFSTTTRGTENVRRRVGREVNSSLLTEKEYTQYAADAAAAQEEEERLLNLDLEKQDEAIKAKRTELNDARNAASTAASKHRGENTKTLSTTTEKTAAEKHRGSSTKPTAAKTEAQQYIDTLESELAVLEADRNKAETKQYDKTAREAVNSLDETTKTLLKVYHQTASKDEINSVGMGNYNSSQGGAIERQKAAKAALKKLGYTDEQITEMVKQLDWVTEQDEYDANYEKWQDKADVNPLGTSAVSVGTNLAGGLVGIAGTAMDTLGKKLSGDTTPINTKSWAMNGYGTTQAIRQTVSQNIADNTDATVMGQNLGAFLYNTGMSMADSGAIIGMTMMGVPATLGTALLSTSVATDTVVSAKEKGLSDTKALATGIAAGVAEAVFEKVSLHHFLKLNAPKGTVFKQVLGNIKNVAAQAGVEASEEIFTDVANALTDAIINGKLSDYNTSVRSYISGGMSEEDARKQATGDFIKEVAMDGVGGFLSGGVFGLFGGGVRANTTAVKFTSAAKNIAIGLTQEKGTDAYENALTARDQYNNIIDKLNSGETVTEEEMNDATNSFEELKTSISEMDKDALKEAKATVRKNERSIKKYNKAVNNAAKNVAKAASEAQGNAEEQTIADAASDTAADTIELSYAETAPVFYSGNEAVNAAAEAFANGKQPTGEMIQAIRNDSTALAELGVTEATNSNIRKAVRKLTINAAEQTSVNRTETAQERVLDEPVKTDTENAKTKPDESVVEETADKSERIDYNAEDISIADLQKEIDAHPDDYDEQGRMTYDAFKRIWMSDAKHAGDTEKDIRFAYEQAWDSEVRSRQKSYIKGAGVLTFDEYRTVAKKILSDAEKNGNGGRITLAGLRAAFDAGVAEAERISAEEEATRTQEMNDTAEAISKAFRNKQIGIAARVSYDEEEFPDRTERAFYDPQKREVVFNGNVLTSSEEILWVLGHELVHPMSSANRGENGENIVAEEIIATFLKLNEKHLLKGKLKAEMDDVDAAVEVIRKRYQRHEDNAAKRENRKANTITTDYAREEFAADLMRNVFQEMDIMKEVTRVAPGLAGKVLSTINHFVRVFNGEAKAEKQVRDELGELSKKVDTWLTEVGHEANRFTDETAQAENAEVAFFSKTGKQYAVAGYEIPNYKDNITGLSGSGFERKIMTREQYRSKFGLKVDDLKRLGIERGDDKAPIFKSGREVVEDGLRYWRDAYGKPLNEDAIQNVLANMDALRDFMRKAEIEYTSINLKDVNNATVIVRRDADGKPESIVLSAMTKNGEYPINFDLTTICKRRGPMSEFMDKLLKEYDLDTFDLSMKSIQKMNEVLSEEGFDTACLGCFVESKRHHMQEFVSKFVAKWNAAVIEIAGKDAPFFNFADSDTVVSEKDVADSIAAMEGYANANKANNELKTAVQTEHFANIRKRGLTPDDMEFIRANYEKGLSEQAKSEDGEFDDKHYITEKELKRFEDKANAHSPISKNDFDKLKKAFGALSTNAEKITHLVQSDKVFQKLLRTQDLMTTDGITKFAELSSELPSLLVGSYGSGAPKLAYGFKPYNNELMLLGNKYMSTDMAHALQTIAGVRMQSFSDFRIENVFDYVQMICDMTIRHMPAHLYTKEIICAKILGLCGVKVNMSVMFSVENADYWRGKEITKVNKHIHMTVEEINEAIRGLDDMHKATKLAGFWINEDGELDYNFSDKAMQQRKEKLGLKSFVQSIDVDEAFKLQDTDGYDKNVGVIGVGYGELQIRAMLRDSRFRYVIPYHSSGLPAYIKQATNLDSAQDHTSTQNTMEYKLLDEDGKDVKRPKEFPADSVEEFLAWVQDNGYKLKTKKSEAGHGKFNLYDDLADTQDQYATAKNYERYCMAHNTLPLFYQYIDEENYCKMLYDFSLTDRNGNFAPQTAVHLFNENGDFTGLPKDTFTKGGIVDTEMSKQNEFNEANYSDERMKEVINKMYDSNEDWKQSGKKYSLADDAEYLTLAKDPEANREKLQAMVDEAAKEAGYDSVYLYHGTNGLRGTVLDTKYSDDNISFFAAEDEQTAKWYSGTDDVKDVGKNISENGNAIYRFLANTKDMYVIHSEGSQWDNILDAETFVDPYDVFGNDELYEIEDYGESVRIKGPGNNYGTYYWNDRIGRYVFGDGIDLRDEKEGGFGYGSTRDIASAVFNSGEYSGVIFKKIADSGTGGNYADVYVFFRPERDLKSADPVTYDDSGNVIPLSERFNSKKTDIRYSLSAETDSIADIASKTENEQLHKFSRQQKEEAAAQRSERAKKTLSDVKKNANSLAWQIYMTKAMREKSAKSDEKIRRLREQKNAKLKNELDKLKQQKADLHKADMLEMEMKLREQRKSDAAAAREKMREKLDENDLAWRIHTNRSMREKAAQNDEKLRKLNEQKNAKIKELRQQKSDLHKADMLELKEATSRRATERRYTRDRLAANALRSRKATESKRKKIDTANGSVPLIHDTSFERKHKKTIAEAAQELKVKGRKLYAAFVNDRIALDRFEKRQESELGAGTLATIVGATSTTTETVYKIGLTDKMGNIIGAPMKDVILCWDNTKHKIDQASQDLFEMYLYNMHNIDRMGFIERAERKLSQFEAENPWIAELDAKDIAELLNMTEDEAEEAGKTEEVKTASEYTRLMETYLAAKDKPVYADEEGKPVSADTSRELVIKMASENPWLAEKANTYYEWWDKFMRNWVVGRSLTADAYETMHELYPHYVPTYRESESMFADEGGVIRKGGATVGANGISASQVVKKAKGSTLQLARVEDSLSAMVAKAIKSDRVNEMLLNICQTAMLDDEDHSMYGDMVVFDWKSYTGEKQSTDITDAQTLVDGEDNGSTQEIPHGTERNGRNNDCVITAWDNGVEYRAYVSQEMYDSITGVAKTATDRLKEVTKVGNFLTAPMKTAITGLNPHFALRNIFRDVPTAVINSESGFAIAFKYIPMAYKEILSNSEQWRVYQALGGTHSNYYNNEGGFAKAMGKKQSVPGKVAKGLGYFNEITEAATRFAEYLATIDKHGDTYESRLRGIKNAAEVTVDFSRHGRYGQAINAWIPYWNPAVQGIDKVFRSVFETPDGKKILRKAMLTVGKASICTALVEALMQVLYDVLGKRDDWEELSDRTKAAYYCIPLKDHTWLKIPKNREWGAILGTPIMMLIEGFNGRDDAFVNYLETAFIPNFLPGGVTDIVGISQIVDIKSNKDFAGRSIVPYAYQVDKDNGSISGMYDEDTNLISKAIASSDLTQFIYDKLGTGLGAMQIDYIVSDYFGDFGEMYNSILSSATWTKAGENSIEENAMAILNTLVTSPWIVDERYSNQSVIDYYESVSKLKQTYGDVKNHSEDSEAYKDTTEYKTYTAVQKMYGEQISALTKQAGELEDGDEKDKVKSEIALLCDSANEFIEDCMAGKVSNIEATGKYMASDYNFSSTITDALIEVSTYADANNVSIAPKTSVPSSSYSDPDSKVGNKTTREYVLDDAAKEEYMSIYNEEYEDTASDVIRSSAYRNGSTADRAQLLADAEDTATENTKERFMSWLKSHRTSTKKQ